VNTDTRGSHERPREAARVLALDEDGRVLLMRGHDPANPTRSWWCAVGGGLQPGETPQAAAVRELAEEAGYAVLPHELMGPLWERTAVFDFQEQPYVQHEVFFLAQVTAATPRVAPHWSAFEQEILDGTAWFFPAEVDRLETEVFPRGLGALVASALPWDGTTRDLGVGE